uniref:Uncharacterized protein n=1 Tax=Nymphaea colorata TaxID=210225 RepID=A0A5K0VYE5_9MAGN
MIWRFTARLPFDRRAVEATPATARAVERAGQTGSGLDRPDPGP